MNKGIKKIVGLMAVLIIALGVSNKVKAESNLTIKQCTATGYCLKGTTATGTNTREGVIAYMPQFFGSTIYVFEDLKGDGTIDMNGYIGVYSCEDTGSANIKAGYVADLWFRDYETAKNFGAKKVILVIVPSEG